MAWFEPLYPYKKREGETPSLLQIEDVNYPAGRAAGSLSRFSRWPFQRSAMPCLTSSPFETVFGRAPQKGEPANYPLLRKMSAHGTGQLTEPDGYEPITSKPPMEKGLRRGQDGKLTGNPLSNRAAADQLLTDVCKRHVIGAALRA